MIVRAIRGTVGRALIPLLAEAKVRRSFSSLMLDRAAIFMIHGLSESPEGNGLSVKVLTTMLEELRARRFSVVSVDSIIERYRAGEPQLPDSVAFTLDDGTKQQMELTIPLLARYDCEATVFVITGYVDRLLWPWDYKIDYILSTTTQDRIYHELPGLRNPLLRAVNNFDRDALQNHCKALQVTDVNGIVAEVAAAAEVDVPEAVPAGWEPLSWAGARSLERDGVRFAPHGVSHAVLSKLSPAESEAEIRDSWQRVKAEMKYPCPVFAWPTGRALDFGLREISYAKAAGLKGAVTASCDYAFLPRSDVAQDRLYRIGRFAMPDNLLDFLQYATWIEHGKQRIFPRRRSRLSPAPRSCS